MGAPVLALVTRPVTDPTCATKSPADTARARARAGNRRTKHFDIMIYLTL